MRYEEDAGQPAVKDQATNHARNTESNQKNTGKADKWSGMLQ